MRSASSTRGSGATPARSGTPPLDERGSAIGDFILFDGEQGLIIERDGSQGDLGGYKAINEIKLGRPGGVVDKAQVVDLLDIADPDEIGGGPQPGDVGVGGGTFAFPFVTIEDVFVVVQDTIGVLNDNNYPFSVGRHLGDPAAGWIPSPTTTSSSSSICRPSSANRRTDRLDGVGPTGPTPQGQPSPTPV